MLEKKPDLILAIIKSGDMKSLLEPLINKSYSLIKALINSFSFFFQKILGKICRISQIYGDGDLRVTYNGSSFTLNSACCSNVPKHQADIHNTIAYHNLEDAAGDYLFNLFNFKKSERKSRSL